MSQGDHDEARSDSLTAACDDSGGACFAPT